MKNEQKKKRKIYSSVIQKVMHYIEINNITQKDLAKGTNIASQRYSKWKALEVNPSIELFLGLAKFDPNFDFHWLLNEEIPIEALEERVKEREERQIMDNGEFGAISIVVKQIEKVEEAFDNYSELTEETLKDLIRRIEVLEDGRE